MKKRMWLALISMRVSRMAPRAHLLAKTDDQLHQLLAIT
jgi:hypothetical protein